MSIMEWTGLLSSAEDRRRWRKIVHETVNPRIEDDWTTTCRGWRVFASRGVKLFWS